MDVGEKPFARLWGRRRQAGHLQAQLGRGLPAHNAQDRRRAAGLGGGLEHLQIRRYPDWYPANDLVAYRLHLRRHHAARLRQRHADGTATGFAAGPNSASLEIGHSSLFGSSYFKGLIDELRIYDTALGQSQIEADRDTPLGTP
jgi:hypothetical protein